MKSGKLSGEQSIVFLVRRVGEAHDSILKIVQEKDIKSYNQEKTALLDIQRNNLCKDGFPNLLSCLEAPAHSEMVIQAFGQNLRKIQQNLKPFPCFSKPTALRIAIQLLDRIERLHSIHYVHNDLKLENVVIGMDDPSKLFLIDFGLSSKFVDENGKHNEKTYLRHFSGNFLFASLNSCRGFNKSRRDDVESIFYILIYMLNEQNLPWCDLLVKDKEGPQRDLKFLLRDRLDLKYTRQLFAMVPSELTDCVKHVLSLDFNQAPDYATLRKTLVSVAAQLIGENALS